MHCASEAISLRQTAAAIVRRLHQAGFQGYWVGGCVRDALLGRTPGDYDIVTNALPEQIESLFPRTIPVGRAFGVVVILEQEAQFQIATFRAESDYQDGRHPEQVSFGDAQADARRRDFTINGLYFDPETEQLLDWVGGQADLEARLIRTIGAPRDRFTEDHLRLLRAVRFAAQLNFEIEPETFAAIRSLAPSIQSVSAERVREELEKLFQPPYAARGLVLLRESGLLAEVLPEIAATVGCEQTPAYHPEGSVFNHLLELLKRLPLDADPPLPWAALLHDVAKPLTISKDATGVIHFYEHEKLGAQMTESILERLKFPRKTIEAVVEAVGHHMQFKDAPKMRKATLRRMLLRPTFPLELELHRLDCLGSHGGLEIYHFLQEQARQLAEQPGLIPPLVKGNDLIALGVTPGPALGALLAEIREKQLGDELTTREEALKWVAGKLV